MLSESDSDRDQLTARYPKRGVCGREYESKNERESVVESEREGEREREQAAMAVRCDMGRHGTGVRARGARPLGADGHWEESMGMGGDWDWD